MLRADVRDLRCRMKRQLASKFVRSHLCMFILKESYLLNEVVRWAYESNRRAAPAYAASMWSHVCG